MSALSYEIVDYVIQNVNLHRMPPRPAETPEFRLVCDNSNEMISAVDEIIARSRKVVIEVSGGVAEATQVPDGVEVEIIDHDNEQHQ
jgi:hypothetical protein